MEGSILTTVILPISLAIIMLGMGLSLVVADFKRVFIYPKAVIIGLTNQLILLPIIGFILTIIFPMSPIMAVGLMLIAACPGGVTSNLITHVSKGDSALSITLTAIASLITVFTIPLILIYSYDYFMEANQSISLNIGKTIIELMAITVIPVAIGMLIRHYKEGFALKMDRPVRIASTVIFIAVLVGIILGNKKLIVDAVKEVGLVVVALNLITMTVGFLAAQLFKLNLKQSISITIESGVQNGTLAIFVALTIIGNSELTIPAAVYSLMMFVSGGFMMWYFGQNSKVEGQNSKVEGQNSKVEGQNSKVEGRTLR